MALALVLAAVPLADPAASAGGLQAPDGLMRCEPTAAGRYVVLGSGQQAGEPLAVLLQETWSSDGRIEGSRWWRQGRRFVEDRYTGSVTVGEHCWARVQRQGKAGAMTTLVALDQQGRPRTALAQDDGQVLALRYLAQPQARCHRGLLNGLVTSQQQGQSWSQERWQPNAVVQREWWQQGAVQGIAVSSYGGRQLQATYSGRLEVGPDCLGRMVQRDSLGNSYAYRVVVRADGGGYVYLQTDPDDLSLGLLQRQP